MNKLIIRTIYKEYQLLEILKAFLTGLLFFAILSALILIPIIQITFLYVPYLEYFLIGIYILMSLNSVYFNKIFVETLQHYHRYESIDYEAFKVRSSTVMTFVIFVILLIVFIVLH